VSIAEPASPELTLGSRALLQGSVAFDLALRTAGDMASVRGSRGSGYHRGPGWAQQKTP
jgi:hypothetical protein